jgi:hypothetical protein
MAKRKRSTRSTTRSPKRSSSRASSGVSRSGLLLAGVVIISVGLLSLWTAVHQKNPPAILAKYFGPSVQSKSERESLVSKSEVKRAETKPREESKADLQSAPVPRPPVPVGPQQKIVTAQIRQAPEQPARVVPRPLVSMGNTMKAIEVPRGRNISTMAPAVVYARERLVLRQHAWDKSTPVAMIEKGREMRSYSKTGKWHRIAVPTTGMIGWVHEDELIIGKTNIDVSSFSTGAIAGTPKPTQGQVIYPPRPVKAR